MIRPPTLFKQVVSYMSFVGGVLFVVPGENFPKSSTELEHVVKMLQNGTVVK